jgi:hypothetical protein
MSCLSFFSRFSRDLMALSVIAVPVLVAVAPRTAHADEGPPVGPPAPAPAPAAAPAAPGASPAAPAAAAPAAPAAAVVQLDADDHRATIERRVGTQSYSGLPLAETGLLSVGQCPLRRPVGACVRLALHAQARHALLVSRRW